jgi:Deoxyribonuclease NucA/NucB
VTSTETSIATRSMSRSSRDSSERPSPTRPSKVSVKSSASPTSTASSCVKAGPTLSPDAARALPVIEFLYIDTDYEPFGDIVKSMCLGMQGRNQGILTYAGSKDPCYKGRRNNASCDGCCAGTVHPLLGWLSHLTFKIGVLKDSGPFKGFPTSCDEYPFASTVEGGFGAHRSCVVAFQNNIQGGYLSAFYKKLSYGQQFIVRVSGIDCSTVQESDLQGCGGAKIKRQNFGDDGTSSSGFEGKPP